MRAALLLKPPRESIALNPGHFDLPPDFTFTPPLEPNSELRFGGEMGFRPASPYLRGPIFRRRVCLYEYERAVFVFLFLVLEGP